ncbi:insulin-like growth factor II [Egretta garzetta]|uniref:insulin-like growth factor II n=1 Tax=Egretta garzetta TaxID=188379 RepID=UPI00051F0492|nr:insulin-like growth factor II [Egretta garzetta]
MVAVIGAVLAAGLGSSFLAVAAPKKAACRPVGRNNRRINRGIVEECCFRSCDLALLETYCAKSVKSERDLSATSLAGLPALNKESFQKPSHAKYSKYDVWQKKSSQRLQRDIPGANARRQKKEKNVPEKKFRGAPICIFVCVLHYKIPNRLAPF